MSRVPEIIGPYHAFAYELVRRVYEYFEIDALFHEMKISAVCPLIFTEEHWSEVLRTLKMISIPLTMSISAFDVNITEGSYRRSVDVVIQMYKKENYSVDIFLQMCTSIAIWAFLARRRGLPHADVAAVDIIRTLTTHALRNGSFANGGW